MFQIFSPYMLKTYEKCHHKFYLKYIKGIQMPANDDVFQKGKNIHALASYYLKKENIDKMEKTLSQNESKLWIYLKSIEYFSYEVVGVEYNLSVKIGDYFFGGRLDALVKNKDTYYILDYKTGSIPKQVESDYQTIIYMLAVKEFYKTNDVKFVYIDLKNKKNVTIEMTDELILNAEKRLNKTATEIKKAENTQLKNLSSCPCEYKLICY